MNVLIIRASGEEETHQVKRADNATLYRLLGYDTFDVVTLTRGKDGSPKLVMLVDDNGYETRMEEHGEKGHLDFAVRIIPTKARWPVNEKATQRYRAVAGGTHAIVGDVAIVDDRDWGASDDQG